MSRGGARPGAGRKKGTRSRLTQTQADKVARIAGADVLPLEVMVGRMRELWHGGSKDEAVAIAEKCAPYFHPRLAAVEHSGNQEKPLAYEVVSSVPRPPMIEHVDSDDRTADHVTH